jgi:5-methylcytosine-specific restriction protein B
MPQGEAIGTANVRGVPLGPWLDSLNARVRKHVGRDARNLQVGHTYLLDGGVPVRDFAKLRVALRDEIFPLLEEYCYDRPDALVEVVGDALYDRERRRFRDELLDGSNDEGLVQALLKPDPGIVTTRAAIDAGELEDDSEPPDPADP